MVVTDSEISSYIQEGKELPADFMARVRLKPTKVGHKEADIELVGDNGSQFEIRLRQSNYDQMDFSVILAVVPAGSGKTFRLRRYNGKTHPHTNKLERQTVPLGFHIHEATERYQLAGFDEDAFASSTDRYTNLQEALECLLVDCACRDTGSAQGQLF